MFELDFAGRPIEAGVQAIAAHGDPLSVIRGRLVCKVAAEQPQLERIIHGAVAPVRIPTKPAMHSNMKPATYSDLKPASVPI
jgi:hypothetical protein